MKKLTLSLVALFVVALVSCEKTDGGNSEQTQMEPGIIEIAINGGVNSYAPTGEEGGSEAESKINTVEIFVFNSNGSVDGETPYTFVSSFSGNQQVKVQSGTGKKILVSANTSVGNQGTANYTTVKQILSSHVMSETNSRTTISTGFHMSGEGEVDVDPNVVNQRVYVTVSRLMSKIEAPTAAATIVDLTDEDIEDLFPGETGTPTFTFDGYTVANGVTQSDAFNYWNSTNNEFASWDLWAFKPYLNSTFNDATGEYTKVYSGLNIAGDDWFLDPADGEVVYVYENGPKKVTSDGGVTGSLKSDVYALIVKGTLELNGLSETRYWRVNLMKPENHKTYRNSIIRVSLDKIVSKGYDTPKDAEEDDENGPIVVDPNQTSILVSIDVAPWRVWSLPTEM